MKDVLSPLHKDNQVSQASLYPRKLLCWIAPLFSTQPCCFQILSFCHRSVIDEQEDLAPLLLIDPKSTVSVNCREAGSLLGASSSVHGGLEKQSRPNWPGAEAESRGDGRGVQEQCGAASGSQGRRADCRQVEDPAAADKASHMGPTDLGYASFSPPGTALVRLTLNHLAV